jgi:formylglycine-generating enzyme required for sulfatase activity
MRIPNTRSRARLVPVLLSIGALLFIIPMSGRVASVGTPQGKGGEVVAKPTPTPAPKKTPTTKRTPPRSSRTSQPSKSSDSATGAEMIFWNSIKDSKNPGDFRGYLKKYPNGEFADLAKNRLHSLEETASWEKIKESANPEAFRDYLKMYPDGEFSGAARNRINTLEAATRDEAKRKEEEARKHPTAGMVYGNQMGMELVYVQPGSFDMGLLSDNNPAHRVTIGSNLDPSHRVTIGKGFYMGKYEVTQAQWQAVMGNNPSHFKDCGSNCPVEEVSWNDAQAFLNKLNEANDGYQYRLPSEAEWEYACRAGTDGDYYAGNVDDIGWYSKNSTGKTHAVGGKQPNAFGLFDMSGNVSEWCQDLYHGGYESAPTDGSAWLSLSGSQEDYQKLRILRGGSWAFDASYLLSAHRMQHELAVRSSDCGFRLVAVARSQ